MGYYHQGERDRAATLGFFGIVAILLLIAMFVAAAVAWAYAP